MMPLILRTFTCVASLPADYDALFAAHQPQNLFVARAWFTLYETYLLPPDGRVVIYAVEAEDKPILALVLCQQKRVLSSLSNYYSSYFSPVIDAQETVAIAALSLLFSALSRECDVLKLNPLAANEQQFTWLISALRAAHFSVEDYFCFGNWYHPVNGVTSQDYLAALPSKLRHTLQRKEKKAKREHTEMVYRLLTEAAEVAESFCDFEAIYEKSWKSTEPHAQFIAALATHCAQQGHLRLGLMYLDGQPAAAQFWIVRDHTAYIFKLAYDPKFKAYSIGSILSAKMMAHVIDVDQVHKIDYLTGDDAYKQSWMSQRREMRGLMAYNRRAFKGWWMSVRFYAVRQLKRIFQRN